MFLGHFAAAYAAKRTDTRLPLGLAFAACQWPDLLWPVLSLAGIEHFRIAPGDTAFTPLAFDYYPWSHSLLMDVIWGTAFALIYLARRGDRRGAVLLGALVVSHWVLDWITHRPDMPVSFGERHLGLGLWNNVVATALVELAMFVAAAALYDRVTIPRDRIGRISNWIFGGILLGIYFGNVFGPPPSSTAAVSFAALGLWLFVFAAEWIDRHRAPRT